MKRTEIEKKSKTKEKKKRESEESDKGANSERFGQERGEK